MLNTNKISIFITGTDTGVGKTLVTGLLARFLLEKGYKTVTQKWVQTGLCSCSGDIDLHLDIMGKTRSEFEPFLRHMVPYGFKHPSSPHLAARLEGSEIDSHKIKESYKMLMREFDAVLVEGSGGALVPLNSNETMIDICAGIGIPALIVAENRLGAINHTLLTVEAFKKRNIPVLGVIFNRPSSREDSIVLDDNPRVVGNMGGVDILGEVPYCRDVSDRCEKFDAIGKKIILGLDRLLREGERKNG